MSQDSRMKYLQIKIPLYCITIILYMNISNSIKNKMFVTCIFIIDCCKAKIQHWHFPGENMGCISRGFSIQLTYKCDWILENSSKSRMKSSVFLHVFTDISSYMYVFPEYFSNAHSNLSIKFHIGL